MMFHLSIKKMTDYLDGQLAENQLLKTQTHLDSCTKCQKKMKLFKVSEKILQVPENPPGSLRIRIMENITEEKRSVSSPVIGEIQSVLGLVSVKNRKTGDALETFPGMVLRKADILKTGNNSRVLIKWKDGSDFYVNEKTEIDFSEQQYPITLQLGEIFAMMKPQRESFEIKTPSTILAVIGTDFDTKVSADQRTILQVLKGKVSFKSKTGDVLVKKSQQVESSEFTKPIVTKIKNKQSIRSWTQSINPNLKQGEFKMKKLLLGIIVIAILVGGYYFYR